ncbi:hypothetical protein BHM03_00031253 [Ensete ventricosum]|nr:hypothetical protein BHM03_00031253 [Ensete ventricosum]
MLRSQRVLTEVQAAEADLSDDSGTTPKSANQQTGRQESPASDSHQQSLHGATQLSQGYTTPNLHPQPIFSNSQLNH